MPVSFLPAPAVATSVISLAFSAHARAQATTARGNAPAAGQRIECSEPATSTDDIEISTSGIATTTTEDQEHGVTGQHSGARTVRIGSRVDTITTGGKLSPGSLASHNGSTSDVFLCVFSTDIRTNRSGEGADADGIWGETIASGRLDAVTMGGSIATRGDGSHGMFLRNDHPGSCTAGPLTLDVGGDISIETSGGSAHGFSPWTASSAVSAAGAGLR